MNWEVINGVTGIISAIMALVSVRYISMRPPKDVVHSKLVSTYKIMSFLLASSGWILICTAYLWFFEPYGSYIRNNEYQKFFGVLISFPAIVLFVFGIGLMRGKKCNEDLNKE